MTAAYRTIPNPVYTHYTIPIVWQLAIPHIFSKLHYAHTYVPIYKFKVFSLHNVLNNNTCTMPGQILLCSSVLRTCTWKIVFKIENNELNELSECMLLYNVLLFRKTSQTCKTLFYKYFPEALLCFACFCTCLFLKVYKTFNTCLLALFYFSLKAYKTLIACLLTSL